MMTENRPCVLLNLDLMKEGYPPVNVKFSDRVKYYSCFTHYRENNQNASKMIELVVGYAIDELKRYIEIAEQSAKLRADTGANTGKVPL